MKKKQKDSNPMNFVRELLDRWGEWQRDGVGGIGNIGYPHQASHLSDHFSGGCGSPIIEMAEDVKTVDRVMARLRQRYPLYYAALEQYYRFKQGVATGARRMNVSDKTFKTYKQAGEMYVDGSLSGNWIKKVVDRVPGIM